MVASKDPVWGSRSFLYILFGLLFVLHGGDARVLRLSFEPSLEVAEVIHRRLQAAPYCIASASANQTTLQNALNWACGTNGGNVDCTAINTGGSCYDPDSLVSHASYAFDSYYVTQGGSSGSCDFGGVATTTTTNPSSGTCVYPSLNGSGTTPSSSNSTSPPPPFSSSNVTISPTATDNSSGGNSPAVSLHWITTTTCSLLVTAFLSSRL